MEKREISVRLKDLTPQTAPAGAEVILPRAWGVGSKGVDPVHLQRIDYEKGRYVDEKQDVSDERVLVEHGGKVELWIGGYPTAKLTERQVNSLKRWAVPDASRDTSKPHLSGAVVTRLPGGGEESAARPEDTTEEEGR